MAVINPEVIPSTIKLKRTPINVTKFFGKRGGGGGALSESGGSGAIIRSSSSGIVSNLASLDPVDRPLSLEEKVDRNQKKITIIKNILKTHQTNHGNQRSKLEEINAILNDIGNALALDFAHRISDAKNIGKQLRRQASKDKFKKERGLFKGDLGFVGRSINKMLAPVKSMFKSVWEALKWTIAGILTNESFKWLQDPKNQKKLMSTLKFLLDNWVTIAVIMGAVILRNIWLTLKGFGLMIGGLWGRLRGLVRWIRFGKLGPGWKPGARSGGVQLFKNPFRNWFKRPAPVSVGKGGSKNIFLKAMDTIIKPILRLIPSKITNKASGLLRLGKGKVSGIPFVGAILNTIIDLLLGESPGRAVSGSVGFGAGSALGAKMFAGLLAIPKIGWVAYPVAVLASGFLGEFLAKESFTNLFEGGNSSVESRDIGGSITKDRLYMVHQDELIRAPFSGTVERAQRAEQILKNSSTFKNRNIIPINLPDIVRPMPEIPDPQSGGEATESPMVSSLNGADHYRHLTASVYGIYV